MFGQFPPAETGIYTAASLSTSTFSAVDPEASSFFATTAGGLSGDISLRVKEPSGLTVYFSDPANVVVSQSTFFPGYSQTTVSTPSGSLIQHYTLFNLNFEYYFSAVPPEAGQYTITADLLDHFPIATCPASSWQIAAFITAADGSLETDYLTPLACFLTPATVTGTIDITPPTAQDFVSISTGDGQIGVAGSSVTTPLTVAVLDASSAPQSGVAVSFAISSAPVGATGQGVLPAQATTGSNGLAQAVLTLGNIPADYYATATIPGGSSVTFHECAKLDGQYFNQAELPWGTTEYDLHAGTTMSDYGCGTTSMAMVARYFGVNVSTDGKPINPGNLNSWLDLNGGYNGTHDVEFGTIGDYTNNAIEYDSNYDGTALGGTYSQAQLAEFIQEDLSNGLPVIARVINPKTGHRHFIVLTGLCSLPNVTYTISDPGNRAASDWSFTSDHTGRTLGYTLLGLRRFTH